MQYLNLSFLIKKSKGGYHLVTAFADLRRYSKPQPSLMPDDDSTLRQIAKWRHIITTDLTSAFYQIPPARECMKYCGGLIHHSCNKTLQPLLHSVENTSSKPCVQSFENLCCGEFSSSPRVAIFLSTVSRYQASVHHVPVAAILPSDSVSSNASECDNPICQVCSFVQRTEDFVTLRASVQSILSGTA